MHTTSLLWLLSSSILCQRFLRLFERFKGLFELNPRQNAQRHSDIFRQRGFKDDFCFFRTRSSEYYVLSDTSLQKFYNEMCSRFSLTTRRTLRNIPQRTTSLKAVWSILSIISNCYKTLPTFLIFSKTGLVFFEYKGVPNSFGNSKGRFGFFWYYRHLFKL